MVLNIKYLGKLYNTIFQESLMKINCLYAYAYKVDIHYYDPLLPLTIQNVKSSGDSVSTYIETVRHFQTKVHLFTGSPKYKHLILIKCLYTLFILQFNVNYFRTVFIFSHYLDLYATTTTALFLLLPDLTSTIAETGLTTIYMLSQLSRAASRYCRALWNLLG